MALRVLWVEQILHSLDVDLEAAHLYAESDLRGTAKLLSLLQGFEDHVDGARYDSPVLPVNPTCAPLHRVSLSRTGLPVGKDASVIAVKCTFNHALNGAKYGLLVVIVPENFVEFKSGRRRLTIG